MSRRKLNLISSLLSKVATCLFLDMWMMKICSWLQPGTYFYHGHFGMQRAAGLYGSLIVDVADGEEEPFKYDGELNLLLSDWYHESIYNQMVGLSSSPMRWIGEPQVNRRLLISKYKSQKLFYARFDLQSEPAKSAVSSKIQNTENISLSTSIQTALAVCSTSI
jgi:hypothetical protein